MEYKVYFLRDSDDNIVYVGMTSRPLEQRFRAHTNYEPIYKNGNGKFYGRDDLRIELFDTYKTREDALHVEGVLKYHLGFRDKIQTDSQYAGKTTLKNKTGWFDPKNKEKVLEGNGKGHKKIKELYSQPVLVYTKNGQFVAEYSGQAEASRQLKINRVSINACINGRRKSAGLYVFKRKI